MARQQQQMQMQQHAMMMQSGMYGGMGGMGAMGGMGGMMGNPLMAAALQQMGQQDTWSGRPSQASQNSDRNTRINLVGDSATETPGTIIRQAGDTTSQENMKLKLKRKLDMTKYSHPVRPSMVQAYCPPRMSSVVANTAEDLFSKDGGLGKGSVSATLMAMAERKGMKIGAMEYQFTSKHKHEEKDESPS